MLKEPNLAYFGNSIGWGNVIGLLKVSERWVEVKYKQCKYVLCYSQLTERSANCRAPIYSNINQLKPRQIAIKQISEEKFLQPKNHPFQLKKNIHFFQKKQ